MKKLVMILIAIATLQASAQEQKREHKQQRMENRTPYAPEEIAQLQAKRMTITLDLNEEQQKQMSAVILEQAKRRESKREAYIKSKTKSETKTRSKDERFQMANNKLDEKIEMQRTMKTVLAPEQYEKWREITKNHGQCSKRYAMRNKEKSRKMTPGPHSKK